MPARGRPILTTIGIEIEFADIPMNSMRSIRDRLEWSLVEDGSCRRYQNSLHGVPLNSGGRASKFGGEFVSPLLDLEGTKWRNDIGQITEALYCAGEGVSVATSIHVHVNATGIPIFALQNLVRVAGYLEAAMYRLSCAEAAINRGAVHMDYAYCRPLTGNGPPVVRCSSTGTDRQVFSFDALKNAKSYQDFRVALGRYDRWDGGKYHEARYTWLNFVSLYQHESIEFRVFNYTHSCKYIAAWARLCSEIVRICFGKVDQDLPVNPLGSSNLDFDDVLEFLMLDDDKVVYQLEDLWHMGSYQRPTIGYQRGHLGNNISWRGVPAQLKPDIVKDTPIYDFYKFRSDLTQLQRGKMVIRTRR